MWTTDVYLNGLICWTLQDFTGKTDKEQRWRTEIWIGFPLRHEISRKDNGCNFFFFLSKFRRDQPALNKAVSPSSWAHSWTIFPRLPTVRCGLLDEGLWVEVICTTSRPGTYEIFFLSLPPACWILMPRGTLETWPDKTRITYRPSLSVEDYMVQFHNWRSETPVRVLCKGEMNFVWSYWDLESPLLQKLVLTNKLESWKIQNVSEYRYACNIHYYMQKSVV